MKRKKVNRAILVRDYSNSYERCDLKCYDVRLTSSSKMHAVHNV